MNAVTEQPATQEERLFQASDRVAELRQLLSEEYHLLSVGKIDQFTSLLALKQRLLEDLAAINSTELMEAFAGTQAWQVFIADLDDCRRRNLVNGAAMTEILKSRSEAFRTLLGHPVSRGDAYKANGLITPNSDPRQLGSA